MSGWMRVSVLVSGVWCIAAIVVASDVPGYPLAITFIVYTVPVWAAWGIYWVVRGFKKGRTGK